MTGSCNCQLLACASVQLYVLLCQELAKGKSYRHFRKQPISIVYDDLGYFDRLCYCISSLYSVPTLQQRGSHILLVIHCTHKAVSTLIKLCLSWHFEDWDGVMGCNGTVEVNTDQPLLS